MPEEEKNWTHDDIIKLAVRVRWEIMNSDIRNRDIILGANLMKDRENYETCMSVFSRWLRHAERLENRSILRAEELRRVKDWIDSRGPITNADGVLALLPNYLGTALQSWLTPVAKEKSRFEELYKVYRPSAIVPEQVVVGTLRTHKEGNTTKTLEEYEVVGGGPKSGSYKSTGMIIETDEREINLLSRFENGDLQVAVFTDIYKSGSKENKVIRMSGVVIGTMYREPYATRMVCEAAGEEITGTGMAKLEDIPTHVKKIILASPEISPLSLVKF